jgi:tetratricopeptide (TPR) repeat protein
MGIEIFQGATSGPDIHFEALKVLLVDDFQGIRTMLREMLKSIGFQEIDQATEGNQAIAALSAKKYDIVLCDFNLGHGKNGQHVLEEAKIRHLIKPTTVWIMITAEKTMDMVVGAAEFRPDDYLIKPLSEGLLRTRLEKHILKKEAMADIQRLIGRKDYAAAIQQCDAHLKAGKGNEHELLRLKCDLCLQNGDAQGARQIYEKLLEQRRLPWAVTGLARLHFQAGELQQARDLLQEVLRENKTYLEAYDLLAKTHEALGDAGEAQQVLSHALELSPNSIKRQSTVGDLAMKTGDLEAAEKAFKKTIALGEHSIFKAPAAYLGLAKVYSEKEEPDEALKVLGTVRKAFDESTEVALQASIAESAVFARDGKPERARAALQEANALLAELGDTPNTNSTIEMANVLLSLGETGQATELLQQVVKNHHDNQAVLDQIQQTFDRAGLGAEGQQAIQTSRQEVIDINNRGVQLARAGKFDDALALLRQAAQMLPQNARIQLNCCKLLVAVMQQQGKNTALMHEARHYIDRVLALNPQDADYQVVTAALDKLDSE